MSFSTEIICGAECLVHVPQNGISCILVLLHGYAMEPGDLSTLALAMGSGALLCLPRGSEPAEGRGRSWWPIDSERRHESLKAGPRDLSSEHPVNREVARRTLRQVIAHLRNVHGEAPVVLAGFSQGGMLACDAFLHEELAIEGMALMSSSCIAWDEWQGRMQRFNGLPVLVSHGRSDSDLSFAAGEALQDRIRSGGAEVIWAPFDGGHEIPLTIWRNLRKLLRTLSRQQLAT